LRCGSAARWDGSGAEAAVDGRGRAVPSLATLVRTSDHPDPKLQFVAAEPAFTGEPK